MIDYFYCFTMNEINCLLSFSSTLLNFSIRLHCYGMNLYVSDFGRQASTTRLSPHKKACLLYLDVTVTNNLSFSAIVHSTQEDDVFMDLLHNLCHRMITFGFLHPQKTKSFLTDSLSLGKKNLEVRMLNSSISFLLNLLQHVLEIDNSISQLLFVSSIIATSSSLTFSVKLNLFLKFNIFPFGIVMLFDLLVQLTN